MDVIGKTRYIFLRHAEARKNIIDITGGEGTLLTDFGREQARDVSKQIIEFSSHLDYTLFSSNILQAKETARIIAREINSKVIVSDDLNPSDMGVLTGMTETQMKELYPKEYDLFQKWRKREIDVTELHIPGIMKPEIFWDQIMGFIYSNMNKQCCIVVTTRSIMVLIANYLDGHTPTPGGHYKHYDVDNCEMMVFDIDEKGRVEVIEKSNQ